VGDGVLVAVGVGVFVVVGDGVFVAVGVGVLVAVGVAGRGCQYPLWTWKLLLDRAGGPAAAWPRAPLTAKLAELEVDPPPAITLRFNWKDAEPWASRTPPVRTMNSKAASAAMRVVCRGLMGILPTAT